MPYNPGDILERNVKLDAPEGHETHPLNKLRVVGPSPVSSPSAGHWQGGSGDCVIVAPVEEFASNEIAPTSALQDEYEIVDYADPDEAKRIELDPPHLKKGRLLTPEEQFAAAAREERSAKRPAAKVRA